MPWWAITYLVLFGALTAGGVWVDLSDRRPWSAAAGLLAAVVAGGLFAAYWRPAPAVTPSPAAVALLVLAAAWEVRAAVRDVRELQLGPDPSTRGEAVTGAALALGLMAPAYGVAGLAAVG